MNIVTIIPEEDPVARDIVDSEMVEDSYCLKRRVVAVICDDREYLGTGWNGPESDYYPQDDFCPRMEIGTGEHYELCDIACPGQRHAEEAAIADMDLWADELDDSIPQGKMTMYVYGHDHICPDCQAKCEERGIETIFLIKKPRFIDLEGHALSATEAVV